MVKLSEKEIFKFVEPHIEEFHKTRIESLMKLKLVRVLNRKNPYLFKAKNMVTSPDLVKSLLDAYLSSQEEGLFGEFLEKLAVFVCGRIYRGKKSAAEGIDLEMDRSGIKIL